MRAKIKYYPITYGQLVATWQILFIASKYRSIHPGTAVEIGLHSGKLGGTYPVKDGLKLCLDYGLVRISGAELNLTQLSEDEIIPHCQDEDPNIHVLRAILFQIISCHNFHWLIFYSSDADIFKQYILDHDPEWSVILDSASLFEFEDEAVIKWWGKVLSKYEDYKDKLKKAVGDVGEKITYHFELNRIASDGFIPVKSFVKWAANISDRFGFDILSLRGTLLMNRFKKSDEVQIEVKASDNDNQQQFRFFISKPEWIYAANNLDSYFFYCWTGINIENESAKNGPFVIPARDIEPNIPRDIGATCEWSECRCVMDVTKYLV